MTEYTTETLHHGPNIITVSRPILDPAEREKRMAAIKEAAVKLVTAQELHRKRKEVQKCKEQNGKPSSS